MNGKVLKTKQRLFQALCELAQEQNLQEISVSSLCRQAGVNRVTFYRYYTIPRDVLVEYLHNMMANEVPNYQEGNPDIALYDVLVAICRICYKNRELLTLLNAAREDILSFMMPFYPGKHHSIEKESRLYFITGGVVGIITQWVAERYPQTPEEIAQLLTEYISMLR